MFKSLTKDYIQNTLLTIARSDSPITSHQIRKTLEREGKTGHSSSTVFEWLKLLYPTDYQLDSHTILFNLHDFLNSPTKKIFRVLIEKLLSLFEIYIDEHYRINKDVDNHGLIWQKETNDEEDSVYLVCESWYINYKASRNYILIYNKFISKSFLINWPKLDEDDHQTGTIRYNISTLETKEKVVDFLVSPNTRAIILNYDYRDNIHFYIRKYNRKNKVKFLDVFLKDDFKIKDQSVRIAYEDLSRNTKDLRILRKEFYHLYSLPFPGISKITRNKLYNILNDSRYWKYRINLRGFLLYLYIEAIEIKNIESIEKSGRKSEGEKKKQMSSKRKRKRLQEVIESDIVRNFCPFLLFYSEFKEIGFDSIEALLNISIEITPQLEYYQSSIYELYKGPGVIRYIDTFNPDRTSKLELDDYILWKVWERYYFEIEKFFITKYQVENETLFLLQSGSNITIYRKLLEFRLRTSIVLQKMIRLEKNSLVNVYTIAYENGREQKVPSLNEFPSPDKFNENFNF